VMRVEKDELKKYLKKGYEKLKWKHTGNS
jgi:hypothetical protein